MAGHEQGGPLDIQIQCSAWDVLQILIQFQSNTIVRALRFENFNTGPTQSNNEVAAILNKVKHIGVKGIFTRQRFVAYIYPFQGTLIAINRRSTRKAAERRRTWPPHIT